MTNDQSPLSFNFDKSSYYKCKLVYNEKFIEHLEKLFISFKSQYFVNYSIESKDANTVIYSFPYSTYGKLSNFFEEQDLSPEYKECLKMIWISQLIRGLEELHKDGKCFMYLSSESITVDDNLNVKFTFSNSPIGPLSMNTMKMPFYFYLAPEYFKYHNISFDKDDVIFETGNEIDNDTDIQKQLDVYALGILINNIIQEKFPDPNTSNKTFAEITKELMNPYKSGYPEKNQSDPFWKDFTDKIIDKCLKPSNERPSIEKISTALQDFMEEKKITIDYNYNRYPIPILKSALNESIQIPSSVKDSLCFKDLINTLNYLDKKYGTLNDFFPIDVAFLNPFDIGIDEYDFFCFFHKFEQSGDEAYYIPSTSIGKKQDENQDENQEEYQNIKDGLYKIKANSRFIFNNIHICNFPKFAALVRSINYQVDVITAQSWIINLAAYLSELELEKNDNRMALLPENFSSKNILVSLMNNYKNEAQFQLSIFPCPLQQKSNIYISEKTDGINADIYAFGVLMFEIFSLLPPEKETKPEDFQSPILSKLFKRFQDINPQFQYNTYQLEQISPFIERCLTPYEQPKSFEYIYYIIKRIVINKNIDLAKMNDQCDNFVKYPFITISKFTSIAHDLETKNSSIRDIVKKCIKDESKQNTNFNQFIDLLLRCINSQMNWARSKSEEEEEEEAIENQTEKVEKQAETDLYEVDDEFYPSIFDILMFLQSIDDELDSLNKVNFKTVTNVDEIKRRVEEAKEKFELKCNQLKPTEIVFESLPVMEVIQSLDFTVQFMNPKIPHVLSITLKNGDDISDDDDDSNNNDNNNNDNNIDNSDDSDEICTMKDIVRYANKKGIKIRNVGNKKNCIQLLIPIKEDIFYGIQNLLKNY